MKQKEEKAKEIRCTMAIRQYAPFTWIVVIFFHWRDMCAEMSLQSNMHRIYRHRITDTEYTLRARASLINPEINFVPKFHCKTPPAT